MVVYANHMEVKPIYTTYRLNSYLTENSLLPLGRLTAECCVGKLSVLTLRHMRIT